MKIVEEDMSKIIKRLKLIYITTATMVEHTHRCVLLQPKRYFIKINNILKNKTSLNSILRSYRISFWFKCEYNKCQYKVKKEIPIFANYESHAKVTML